MSDNTKYDVFVSFRGTDIRPGFLGHLTDAFNQKKINAFVDEKLEPGDDIWPSLCKAIEESFISLIIFSKDYASSRWCLEELVKILECREKYGQTVIPVFYEILPAYVRQQIGGYGDALAKHAEKYNLVWVENWRDALQKAANISGIVSSNFRNEAVLLEKIIQAVNVELIKLSNHSVDSKGLVGIGKHVAHLATLLRDETKEVLVIGIWGMGGIGKTTIAEEVFNKLRPEYEGGCFLENAKEESGNSRMISLKDKLFSTLLKEDVKINSPNGLSSEIVRRTSYKKVLIVLDNVNDSDLLRKIFGSLDWLRSGSRIILTARDKQLNVLSQNNLDLEYDKLSECVINYAKGIPLVLKVLGHLLHRKDKEIWKSQLDKLERMPNKKVYDIMKLSYDDLDQKEQKVFLDLACIFCLWYVKVDYRQDLLKDSESDKSVLVVLKRLEDKALITISQNKISMHDLIKDMGREIVRQESIEDPKNRSRLWDEDDIYKVFQNNQETEAIRSITMCFSRPNKRINLSPHVFSNLYNLRFLVFYSPFYLGCFYVPQGLECFPSELRYLHWDDYPLKYLPKNFSAENLVILNLSYGRVQKLWHGVQNLVNLKSVELCSCKFLEVLPDFSKATNLEVLDASECEKLTSVHPSILSLKKLQKLDLRKCKSLTRLVSSNHLSSLRLGSCRKLTNFSVTSENMVELDLWCTHVNTLPSSFGSQRKLEILCLGTCDIESLPSSIKSFTRLRYLNIQRCKKLCTLPELPASLETLLAKSCKSLKTISFHSMGNKSLKSVEFLDCLKLDEDSLVAIGSVAQVSLTNFACQHLSALEHNYAGNYDDYYLNCDSYQAKYLYPGSDVPNWFVYKTKYVYQVQGRYFLSVDKTTTNDIIIDLSSTQRSAPWGFIFCFIVNYYENRASLVDSCSRYFMSWFKQYRTFRLPLTSRFRFKITISDCEGKGKSECVEMYTSRPHLEVGSNHVCMIYDRRVSCYLNSIAKDQTRFRIEVELVNTFHIGPRLTGLGIYPISLATFDNFIQ